MTTNKKSSLSKFVSLLKITKKLKKDLPKIDTTRIPETIALKETLHNLPLRTAFLEFSQKEHSAENVYFWIRVQNFKLLAKKEERRAEATRIFEECLDSDGEFAVNVTELMKKNIKELLDSGEDLGRNTFDQLQIGKLFFASCYSYFLEVMNVMQDSHKRFVQSQEYRNVFIENPELLDSFAAPSP